MTDSLGTTTIGERQAIARGVQFGDARYPDRFWARVTVQDDGCWVWGGVRARGYGNISIDGKNTRVHRAALTLIGVHVPPIMVVDHMCRNRACVNPDHLRVVSPRTNALENNIGPTAKNAVKTHCPAGHALTGDNVYKDRKNWRSCVTCKMEATYRYKHGKGADLKARRERALEEHREAQAVAQEMGFPAIMEALRSKNTTTNAPVADREGGQQGDYGGQIMPWHGEQPIERHAKTFRGRQWVPLDAAIAALQFWQERDWQHGQSYSLTKTATNADMRGALERIDMLLFCPKCGKQHIDEPAPMELGEEGRPIHWTNPPHRSHLCHSCGCIWRPADVATNGVASIATKGSADTWEQTTRRVAARYVETHNGGRS